MVLKQKVELASDGLPALVQGSWSKDKLYFAEYFMSLFSTGMKNKWSARAYVDLFAGPGMCVDRNKGDEFAGSALRALNCTSPFTHLYFNDIEQGFVSALMNRQRRLFPSANVTYSNLDCNDAAPSIRSKLPSNGLILVLIDPWSYELTFDSLEALVQGVSADLIVTFHSTGIKRNAHRILKRVDEFLGDSTWRNRYWTGTANVNNPRTKVLIDTYKSSLQNRLGYQYFGNPQPIRNEQGAPFFYLLFASHHPTGLEFWGKSSAKMRSGQRVLF